MLGLKKDTMSLACSKHTSFICKYNTYHYLLELPDPKLLTLKISLQSKSNGSCIYDPKVLKTRVKDSKIKNQMSKCVF